MFLPPGSPHPQPRPNTLLTKETKYSLHPLHTNLWSTSLQLEYSLDPGWIAQLVRASSQYANVVGSIFGESIYKKQPMNAYISRTMKSMSPLVSLSISLSLSPSLSLSLSKKINNLIWSNTKLISIAYKILLQYSSISFSLFCAIIFK